MLTNALPPKNSRGQHERPTQGHHRHSPRRARQPSRTSLHPWQSCAILYCAGYVEVRLGQATANLPVAILLSSRPLPNKSDRTQANYFCFLSFPYRNAPMFRSRNVRGRGVGLARGRATVSRARAGGRGGAR